MSSSDSPRQERSELLAPGSRRVSPGLGRFKLGCRELNAKMFKATRCYLGPSSPAFNSRTLSHPNLAGGPSSRP